MPFLRDIYYDVKPFVPFRIRMALRRHFARKILARSHAIWPIDPSAAKKPEGWLGWPNGKQFAFVLTHDVEGPRGLANCRKLMNLEMSMGFRSSFHFIPEGTYETPRDLREELAGNGFEVAVHDLHHNGKLYRSKNDFVAAAKRINHYLQAWNATGFRSGFMHHNLEWLHDLDISYDMSTFDTDPFEPQPEGANTIFPFFVTSPGKNGYVELPYTLPQDSTLFLLLRHHDIRVWKDKLDWIAAHGGMALVNVHPDYIDFDQTGNSSTFSLKCYVDFLQYVRSAYGTAYWQALPSEVCTHAKVTTDPRDLPPSGALEFTSHKRP